MVGGFVMGGRGSWAEKNKNKGDSATLSKPAGGGGGGDTEGFAEYDGPAMSKFTIVNSDITSGWNGWKGSLTVKDNEGNLHTSTTVKAGASRVTFIFDKFVVKLENLTNWRVDQNAGDIAFLKKVDKADRKYFTQVLSSNKSVNVMKDGKLTSAKAIVAARAKPTTEKLTQREHEALRVQFQRIVVYKYNLSDVEFPMHGDNEDHNMFIVNRNLFQLYDYGFR